MQPNDGERGAARDRPPAARAARRFGLSRGALMGRPELEQALGGLLGPAGPEVGCDVCFDELDRFVELEVAGRDADAAIPALLAHLEGCPACREEHESLYALTGGEQGL